MEELLPPKPPSGWGADELSRFLHKACQNTYATFHNLKPEYERLSEIDAVFRQAIGHLSNTKDLLPGLFGIQSHSAFLAAVRLLLGGQPSETYACLRMGLECALYGFYFSKHPASAEIWLSRHTSDDAKKSVREEFTVKKLLDTLKASDDKEGRVAGELYNETIDYGAHPNERALIQRLKMTESEGCTEFQTAYLVKGDSPAALLALRRAAQVGICCLGIFRLVYPERFELIGLTDLIGRLRRGL